MWFTPTSALHFCRDTERNKEIAFLEAQVYEYVEILGVSCKVEGPSQRALGRDGFNDYRWHCRPFTGAEAADSRERPEETGQDGRGARGRGGGAAQRERERRRGQRDHLQSQEPAAGLGWQSEATRVCMCISRGSRFLFYGSYTSWVLAWILAKNSLQRQGWRLLGLSIMWPVCHDDVIRVVSV